VVKLSFAHAEGRNYWQLPDSARLREEPSPADIVCFKRYSFSEFGVSGWMSFFGTGVIRPKVTLGSIMRVGSGIKMGGPGNMTISTADELDGPFPPSGKLPETRPFRQFKIPRQLTLTGSARARPAP
jgi:hypothetical protein